MTKLSTDNINLMLKKTAEWTYLNNSLEKHFTFKNYKQVLSFVNKVAQIAHEQDHHPDISFGFNTCCVTYTTHSHKGVTDLDFKAVASIDKLNEFSS
ncbi:hypothetical protein AB834_05920 [PVC group bacterium (ex Bugula neritina AB1)]|nr:hypothetical protein AB834_05920 [PVC group bacterium (ex Bugula neritina AB1)]